MASKKRGGLSKREIAASQKSLVKKTSRPAVRATASKAVAPLVGAGPLMKGQSRVGGVVQGAGPLLQGQKRDNSYSGGSSKSDSSSRRKEAAKAAKIKNTGLDLNAAFESGGLTSRTPTTPLAERATTLKQGSSSLFDRLKNWGSQKFYDLAAMRGDSEKMLNPASRDLGGLAYTEEDRARNRRVAFDNTLGVPTTNAAYNPDLPTGAGNENSALFDLPMPQGYQEDLASAFGYEPQSTVIDRNTPGLAFDGLSMPENLSDKQKESRKKYSNDGNDVSVAEEMGGSVSEAERMRQLQNELYGGGQQADAPGRTVGPVSGRGSGRFATGKGYQGNPLLDEYQAQLKGFKKQGNKMEDLYDEMIKSLDPTYDSYSADIKKSVDEELRQNLLQLSSVMNANNTGDSEQRAQFMAQRQGQSEAQLGDLLRKLMLQKQEDISGIKEKKAGALERLGDRQMTTREKMAQLMSQLQESPRGTGRASSGKGSTGNRDAEFEKSAKSLVQQVLMGRMNRDAAARNLSTFFPDYDENVIYDLLPDNYSR